jgi:hypothetical protein
MAGRHVFICAELSVRVGLPLLEMVVVQSAGQEAKMTDRSGLAVGRRPTLNQSPKVWA